jgi:HPr kinase/phosphorylase
MPVAPGRNVAILVETAARNQLMRRGGSHAARRLAARLDRRLREGASDVVSADDVADDDGEAP